MVRKSSLNNVSTIQKNLTILKDVPRRGEILQYEYYHRNGKGRGLKEFAKLHALRAFVPYVPSRLTRLRTFAPYAPSSLTCLRALRALITRFARLICYLPVLLNRDIKSLIKGNFKMF